QRQRACCGRGACLDAELRVDVLEMLLDRAAGGAQDAGDVPAGLTLRDPRQDLSLASSEAERPQRVRRHRMVLLFEKKHPVRPARDEPNDELRRLTWDHQWLSRWRKLASPEVSVPPEPPDDHIGKRSIARLARP